MCQAVGTDLAQDAVSGTDAVNTLLNEGITKMLLAKSDHPVIGFQKVCDNHIPIVVAVHIFHSENGVRFVLRQHGEDGGVLAK